MTDNGGARLEAVKRHDSDIMPQTLLCLVLTACAMKLLFPPQYQAAVTGTCVPIGMSLEDASSAHHRIIYSTASPNKTFAWNQPWISSLDLNVIRSVRLMDFLGGRPTAGMGG